MKVLSTAEWPTFIAESLVKGRTDYSRCVQCSASGAIGQAITTVKLRLVREPRPQSCHG